MSDRFFARFINDKVLPAMLSNPAIRTAYPHLAFKENPWGKAAIDAPVEAGATPWVLGNTIPKR